MKIILVLAFATFVGYALYTQYNKTPAEDPVPKRVWASLLAAATTLGTLIGSWFNSGASQ